MSAYTIVNLMEIENKAAEGGSTTDVRFARSHIDSEHLGVSHFRYAPNKRGAKGHSHKSQEEVYVVLGGSGTAKLDDDRIPLRQWDIVRVAPTTVRGFEAGPDGLELLAVGSDRPEGGDGVVSDDDWWGD